MAEKMIFNLNLNQAAFSSNWKGGGINWLVSTQLDYKVDYKDDKQSWDNEIGFTTALWKLRPGISQNTRPVFVDNAMAFGRSARDAFISFNFSGNFIWGYKYSDDGEAALISDFLAPAFVTVAVFEYQIRSIISKCVFLPLAPRLTLLRNNNGRFDAVDSIVRGGVKWWGYRFGGFAFQTHGRLR